MKPSPLIRSPPHPFPTSCEWNCVYHLSPWTPRFRFAEVGLAPAPAHVINPHYRISLLTVPTVAFTLTWIHGFLTNDEQVNRFEIYSSSTNLQVFNIFFISLDFIIFFIFYFILFCNVPTGASFRFRARCRAASVMAEVLRKEKKVKKVVSSLAHILNALEFFAARTSVLYQLLLLLAYSLGRWQNCTVE